MHLPQARLFTTETIMILERSEVVGYWRPRQYRHADWVILTEPVVMLGKASDM
jgi:hypothetical protein